MNRTILILTLLILCLPLVLGATPSTPAVTVTPTTVYSSSNLTVNCLSYDTDGDNLSYVLTVYLNGAVNQTISNDWCYQESATVDNQSGTDGKCSLSYTGNYNALGAWFSPSNTYDGDWDTWGYGGVGQFMYINYSKPSYSIGGVWQVKIEEHTSGSGTITINTTIPEDCFDLHTDKLELRVRSDGGGTNVFRQYCNNGSDWIILSDYELGRIYEEAIYWNVGNYTQNTSINLVNVSYTDLTVGDTWTFQCTAYDGITYSSSTNTSIIVLTGPYSSSTTIDSYVRKYINGFQTMATMLLLLVITVIGVGLLIAFQSGHVSFDLNTVSLSVRVLFVIAIIAMVTIAILIGAAGVL